jgi:hypothetical protein
MKFSRANIPQQTQQPQTQVAEDKVTEEEVAAYEYQQSKKMVRLKIMMAVFLIVVSMVLYHWYKSRTEGAGNPQGAETLGDNFAKKMIRAMTRDGEEIPGGRQPKDEVFHGRPPPASMQNIDLLGLVATLKRNNVFLWGRTKCAPTAAQRALFGERGTASRQAFEEQYKECFNPMQDCPGIQGFPTFVKLDKDGKVVDKITGLVRNLEKVRQFATRDIPKPSVEIKPVPPEPAKENDSDIDARLTELEKKGKMLNTLVDELVKERVKAEMAKLQETKTSGESSDSSDSSSSSFEIVAEKDEKNIEDEAKELAKQILNGKDD